MGGLQPFNRSYGEMISTDAPGVAVDQAFDAHMQISATNATAASATGIHSGIALTSATQTITAAFTNPSVPRAMSITGNQAGVTGNVVITGTNFANAVITETLAANGATEVDGAKAFKTITQVVVPVLVGAGDSISIGFTEKIGIPYLLPHNTVLNAYLNNVKESTAPTVTTSATAIESNTIKLNSTLNGSVVDIYLLV